MIARPRILGLRAGLAVLACAVGIGCGGPRVDYEKAMWSHTQRLQVVWRMGTALDLRATYLSDAFRQTLVDEQARLLGPVMDVDGVRIRSEQDGDAYHEIVFSAASSLYDDEVRFDRDDEGWRLKLVDEAGREQALVSVFRLRRASALDRALFVHDTVWSELWVARFSRDTRQPTALTLHVGSGYGHGEARFEGEQLR